MMSAARLCSTACALTLLVCSLLRSIDTLLFDATLNTMIAPTKLYTIATLLTFTLMTTALTKPYGTAAVLVPIWAAIKHQADRTLLPQNIECGGRRCEVLITGGNSGIGYAVAQELVRQNHAVWLACRSTIKCRAAAAELGGYATPVSVPLDLADLNSVRNFSAVLAAGPGLDLVVGSAGVVPVGHSVDSQGWESGLGVMHFGHWALLNWLNRSATVIPSKTRVVMVSSAAMRLGSFHTSLFDGDHGEGDLRGEHTTGCPITFPLCLRNEAGSSGRGWVWSNSYSRAKLANVLLAYQLARLGWLASSVHPGMVMTPMAKRVSPHLFQLADRAQDLFMNHILRSPSEAAAVILRAASTLNGSYHNGMGDPVPAYLIEGLVNDRLAEKLWEVTAQQVGMWEQKNYPLDKWL